MTFNMAYAELLNIYTVEKETTPIIPNPQDPLGGNDFSKYLLIGGIAAAVVVGVVLVK